MGEKHTQKNGKLRISTINYKKNLEFFNKFAQTATKKIEIATTTTTQEQQQRKGAPGNNPLNCENCRKTATKERNEKGGEWKVDSRDTSLFIELSSVSFFVHK